MVNFSYFRAIGDGIQQEAEMVERDRRKKFVELANKRTHSVVKSLRLIGNLSSRANYKWEDEDAKKIFRLIKKEVRAAEEKFRGTKGEDDEFRVIS